MWLILDHQLQIKLRWQAKTSTAAQTGVAADDDNLRGDMLDWVWSYFNTSGPAAQSSHPHLSGKASYRLAD